jgi:hypothetical protein
VPQGVHRGVAGQVLEGCHDHPALDEARKLDPAAGVSGFRVSAGPEHGDQHTRQGQQSSEGEELSTADALAAVLSVVPGEHQRHEEAHPEGDLDASLEAVRQVPRLGHHIDDLKREPRPGQVGQRPLHDLPLLEAVEEGHGR